MALSVNEGILFVLGNVSGKYGKKYCYPSQEHILRLLERFHFIYISRRTLNRHLKKLEQRFYFERTQRHIKGPGEKAIFRTTMYKLRWRLFKFMEGLRNSLKNIPLLRRVPQVAQYSSEKQGRDLKVVAGNVEKLWNSVLKGKPSPVSLHG